MSNRQKSSPKFLRRFNNSVCPVAYCGHAEMILLDRLGSSLRPGETINVIRFTMRGQVTMAKPCVWCQKFMTRRGVTRVRYTNWSGDWEKMLL